MKPRKDLEKVRKEVESIKDADGTPIEPGIKELVVGLRRWQIELTGSCGGHPEREDAHDFPWVLAKLTDLDRLTKIVGWWNYKHWCNVHSEIEWVTVPRPWRYGNITLRPLGNDKSLEKLRKEAEEFGLWLQELPAGIDWEELPGEELNEEEMQEYTTEKLDNLRKQEVKNNGSFHGG